MSKEKTMKKIEQSCGECAHKNIKFFEKKNRIICLDCGDDWNQQTTVVYYQYPAFQPFIQTDPFPTWSLPATITCASDTGQN